ncbi:MAG: AAA family ATPase, partial [Kiritimatiellae bacterium]|nr:AAA family ATPase [Kiritimatiellia bacterium]
MDLFGKPNGGTGTVREPLATRMRPRTLQEIIGQDHILGPGKLLRRAVEADRLGSIILYGPPGCGKTSLAEVIARVTRRHFERTSGVVANVSVLRTLIQEASQRRGRQGIETILFIDEIHRFNEAQQDVLLQPLETGVITLIGATTHNPLFFINAPLVSRSMIFELRPLSEEDICEVLRRALTSEQGLAGLKVRIEED